MISISKYLIFIELCCSICYFKNYHNGHKMIEINDEESLKKENITIELFTKEFIKKPINLKNKI